MPFQTVPRQRRKSLGLFLVLLVCLSTFAVLIRSNLSFDLINPPDVELRLQQKSQQPQLRQNRSIQVAQQPTELLSTTTTTTQAPKKPNIPLKKYILNPQKSKYVFDHTDIDFTKQLRIDKVDGCGMDNGFGVDLVVVVFSQIEHFEERSAIRDTWGGFNVERGGYLYFVLGSDLKYDEELQANIESEDAEFGDILQGNFPDSAQVLKSVAMLKWALDYCSRVRYIVKLSDDAMVNMQKFVDYAETATRNRKTILGTLNKNWKSSRDPNDPYYISKELYPRPKLPTFIQGPNYLLTSDAVKPLYQAAMKEKSILYLEDVFITGIVADKAKIKRLNLKTIQNTYADIDECNFNKQNWINLGYNSSEIRRLWDLVYDKKCEV